MRSLTCCLHNLRRLMSTPRAWVALIVCVLFFRNEFMPIRLLLQDERMTISWAGLLMYLFNDPAVTMITAMMLLMLVFEAPMVDETQRYIISRTGRASWARGQIGYLLAATFLFMLFQMLVVLMLVLPWADWTGWGTGLKALVEDGMYEVYDTMLNYDVWLMRAFTPFSGALLSMTLHYLAYACLALLLCAVNALARNRLGFLVAAAPVMLDYVADEYFSGNILYALPVTLSRLSQLDYGDEMGRPPVWYAYAFLGLLLTILLVVCYRLLRKREIYL